MASLSKPPEHTRLPNMSRGSLKGIARRNINFGDGKPKASFDVYHPPHHSTRVFFCYQTFGTLLFPCNCFSFCLSWAHICIFKRMFYRWLTRVIFSPFCTIFQKPTALTLRSLPVHCVIAFTSAFIERGAVLMIKGCTAITSGNQGRSCWDSCASYWQKLTWAAIAMFFSCYTLICETRINRCSDTS